MNNQYKKILNSFFEFESKNNLFEAETENGIKYWDIIRYGIISNILFENKIIPDSYIPRKPKFSIFDKFKNFIYILYLSIFSLINYFRKRSKSNIMIFVSSRNIINGKYVDLLLKDIIDSINEPVCIVECFTTSHFETLKKFEKNKYFLTSYILKLKMAKPKEKRFDSINELIHQEFGFYCDYSYFINSKIKEYEVGLKFFKKLLKKNNINTIFFQSEPKSIIAAANQLNIKIYDYQHGHFNSFDPFYSYPDNFNTNNLDTVVKNILTLGPYWDQFVHSSINKHSIGSNYFFPNSLEYDSKNILIIANRFTHDMLLNGLLKLAPNNKSFNFIYKMHSNQSLQFKSTIAKTSHLENVNILIYDDINVLLMKSKLVVLIQSTVAYQALQLGLNVAIIKSYFYEASEDIFENEKVHLIDEFYEIEKILNNLDNYNYEISNVVYFEKFNESKFLKII